MINFQLERGTFRLIRVDGSEQNVREKPTMSLVSAWMQSAAPFSLLLEREQGTGIATLVMIVDETSTGKAPNEKANAIAREYYGPKYRHEICGDVVIADDRDF